MELKNCPREMVFRWSYKRGHAYIRRWAIEETIRYIKLSCEVEDVRVLNYRSLQNLMPLVWSAAHFAAVLMDSASLSEVIRDRISSLTRAIAAMDGMERKTTKLPIGVLVPAIEKETGVGFLDLVSRRRGEGLRSARGILVSLSKEIGYTLTDLQKVLKRDVRQPMAKRQRGRSYCKG